MGERVGGKFTSDGDVPPCPFDGHRGSRAQSYGSLQRKDGTWDVEDDKATRVKLAVFREAETICGTGLASATDADTKGWKEVEARLRRLRGRINAATKKPPVAPYNTRPPHRSRFVKV